MQAGFPQTNHKAVAGPLLPSYCCAALGVICVRLVGSGFPWVSANAGFCRRIEPNGISQILQTKPRFVLSYALDLL